MKIVGPDHYRMVLDARSYKVRSPSGVPHFGGRATARGPKLYVVSSNGVPIYVGITTQPMSARLRYGWTARGKGGYYGYAWRHQITEADLDIWYHLDPPDEKPMLEMETVEAEVVFLIRQAGQWPQYQTEVHFHASTEQHRRIAREVAQRCGVARSV